MLTLLPRDYLCEPYRFGQPGPHQWDVPTGGTLAALRAARRQHKLACHWRRTRTPKSGAIRATYGISKQTWSRIVLGQRWAGQLGLEVLLDSWHAIQH